MFYGYNNHTTVDLAIKLIVRAEVTNVFIHERQTLDLALLRAM
jgi:hypothetical protein